jgi:hypothetical protein
VWSSTRPLVAAHAAIASVIAVSQAWQTPAPSTMPARVIAQFAPTWSATMLPAAKVTTAPATESTTRSTPSGPSQDAAAGSSSVSRRLWPATIVASAAASVTSSTSMAATAAPAMTGAPHAAAVHAPAPSSCAALAASKHAADTPAFDTDAVAVHLSFTSRWQAPPITAAVMLPIVATVW